MSILLIDNYDSFTFNLYQLVASLTSEEVIVKRNDAITLAEIIALKPSKIILSPGPGSAENDADFGVCKDIIASQQKLRCPVLGVCLGHQGIAFHLGGKIARAPQIVHGKSSQIEITAPSKLLDGLPQTFEAMRYHSLVALDEGLPKELVVTARDTQSHLIMAFHHVDQPFYGVQFHPESIGTPRGAQIMRNFLEKCN
jgi:anthranilate synthase component II